MTTAQAPIGSGFGAASTAEAVIRNIDLTGKTVIVTGGYSGIGLEAARVFSEAGAKVIVPARDTEKAERALSPLPGVELEKLDLMDPASIDAFAERFLATARPLHILLNNAAVMMNPLTRDARGYESQFSTNHLGHFQLTARLWPALKQAHGARVVAVSSRGHTFSDVDFDDPNFERRPYDPRIAYGQAKTAMRFLPLASMHAARLTEFGLSRCIRAEFSRRHWRATCRRKPSRHPAMSMKTVTLSSIPSAT
jgi:NAD(P)-dependent dehydrogenase (short-subunit alcohol dehydrogenase family)